ncbi:MAG: glycosyltransferase family 4 protein [Thaumarchaeota archaeon]|nr:glycosyltransferase family 4 protein [Nitrososphaerota archaeon]
MRVALIHSSSGISGIKEHVKTLASYLEQTGIQVYVFSPSLEAMSSPLIAMKELFVLMDTFIKKEKVNLLHVHSLMPLGLCSLTCKLYYNIPYVITVHGGEIHWIGKTQKYKRSYETILKESSKVICISNFLSKELTSFYDIPRESVEVIPNGIDLERFKLVEDGKKLKSKLHLDGKKIILYVGRLSYEKGLNVLLLALKKVLERDRNIVLVIVGDGPIKNELKVMSLKLRINPNVFFVGSLESNCLPSYYSMADVVVIPSIYEAQSLVLLEAMASGKPVIASNIGGLREIVTNRVGLLVKPYDCKALSEAILYLLNNEEVRKLMSLKAHEEAKKYDIRIILPKIISVYEKVLLESSFL